MNKLTDTEPITIYDVKHTQIDYDSTSLDKSVYPNVKFVDFKDIRAKINFKKFYLDCFFTHEVSIKVTIIDTTLIEIKALWQNN